MLSLPAWEWKHYVFETQVTFTYVHVFAHLVSKLFCQNFDAQQSKCMFIPQDSAFFFAASYCRHLPASFLLQGRNCLHPLGLKLSSLTVFFISVCQCSLACLAVKLIKSVIQNYPYVSHLCWSYAISNRGFWLLLTNVWACKAFHWCSLITVQEFLRVDVPQSLHGVW